MFREIKHVIEEEIMSKRLAGASFSVIENDETHSAYLGFSDLDNMKTINLDSIFEIGSLTKTFVGLLASKLILDKKLNLEDNIKKYLKYESSDSFKQITLKQLLTHTSGLPRLPSNLSPSDINNPYNDYGVELLAEEIKSLDNLKCGNYLYSNLGFALVGMIIEAATGSSIEENIKSEILGPLQMNSTFYDIPNFAKFRMSTGYNCELDIQKPWSSILFKSSGGIKSSLADMSKYLEFVLNNNDHPLRAALNYSITAHYISDEMNMGLGWHLGEMHENYLSHDGATFGFYSKIRVSKKNKKGLIILMNTYNELDGVDNIFDKT